MFTIEHDFDATVITLIDEAEAAASRDAFLAAWAELPKAGDVE